MTDTAAKIKAVVHWFDSFDAVTKESTVNMDEWLAYRALRVAVRDLEEEIKPPPSDVGPRDVPLTNGAWVIVHYKSPSQKLPRVMRGQFMGGDHLTYSISLRPLMGTQEMPRAWVTDIITTDDHTPMLARVNR